MLFIIVSYAYFVVYVVIFFNHFSFYFVIAAVFFFFFSILNSQMLFVNLFVSYGYFGVLCCIVHIF